MTEKRLTFVVVEAEHGIPGDRFMATLGDYDLDAPTGHGDTPSEAIGDWLDMHGEIIDEEGKAK